MAALEPLSADAAPMSQQPSMENRNRNVIASWAVAVAQALDERGIDSRAIFSSADIDIGSARETSIR